MWRVHGDPTRNLKASSFKKVVSPLCNVRAGTRQATRQDLERGSYEEELGLLGRAQIMVENLISVEEGGSGKGPAEVVFPEGKLAVHARTSCQ